MAQPGDRINIAFPWNDNGTMTNLSVAGRQQEDGGVDPTVSKTSGPSSNLLRSSLNAVFDRPKATSSAGSARASLNDQINASVKQIPRNREERHPQARRGSQGRLGNAPRHASRVSPLRRSSYVEAAQRSGISTSRPLPAAPRPPRTRSTARAATARRRTARRNRRRSEPIPPRRRRPRPRDR